MCRKYHNGQPSIEEFHVPFGGTLDPDNRWVLFSSLMSWEELEETYAPQFSPSIGAPAKSVRMAFGALFIKQRLGLTDEETVEQIRENPYLQFFLGFPGYSSKVPFDPSMMVHFRKRFSKEDLMGLSRFNGQVAKPSAQPRMNIMTRHRRRFTPQQKAEAIALCQSEGLTILEASKRLGIHATCLGRWIRQAGIDAEGPTKNGLLSRSEREEMTRLKKKIRELKRERDFFKLVAAYFAKEQLSLKSTNS